MKQSDLKNLKNIFGFDQYRKGQQEIIKEVLAGKDVLTVMPTGAGKSLCFQVPAVVNPGLTVVISPLLSLLEDQINAVTSLPNGKGIPAMAWCSNSTVQAKTAMFNELTRKVHPNKKNTTTTQEKTKRIITETAMQMNQCFHSLQYG